MKKLLSILTVTVIAFLFSTTNVNAQKVYKVKYESQADIKVYVVKYESQCDLKVYHVKYESQARKDGLWYSVDYESQADKKVYYVDYESQADLKIYYVDYESQAGWKNSSKAHLLKHQKLRNLLIISFLLFVWFDGFGQSIPKFLILDEEDNANYESQGMYHSTHLYLYQDSSFVFYSVYEVGYKFSLGKYVKDKGKVILNWNREETMKAVSDTSVYYKYYRYSTPYPIQLENIIYEIKKDSLILN